jgi:hypothetical protein
MEERISNPGTHRDENKSKSAPSKVSPNGTPESFFEF